MPGAIIETALAPNFWNLPLSILGTPPADITLDAAKSSPRFLASASIGNFVARVGFDRTDVVYLKSYAFYSNLGDGLVPGLPSRQNMEIAYSQIRFFPALTGTISNIAGSAAVTGTGTLFTKELCPGQTIHWLDDNGTNRAGLILSVASDTALTLAAVSLSVPNSMYTGDTTGQTAYPEIYNSGENILEMSLMNQPVTTQLQLSNLQLVKPISGSVTTVAGNPVLTGTSTVFTTEIQPGQFIRVGSGANLRTLKVNSVTNNGALTLTVPGAGVAGVPISIGPIAMGWQDSFIGYNFRLQSNNLYYTITIDPAFAASDRVILFGLQAEIDHNTAAVNEAL